MKTYFIRRILLIPLTLALILGLNFVLIHCIKEKPNEREDQYSSLHDLDYGKVLDASFEEYYGLKYPLFFNSWPLMKEEKVKKLLMVDSKLGVKAPFILEELFHLAQKGNEKAYSYLAIGLIQKINLNFQGGKLPENELKTVLFLEKSLNEKNWNDFESWIKTHKEEYRLFRSYKSQLLDSFTQTRLFYYFKRVIQLDFGKSRCEFPISAKKVVLKHLKVSSLLLFGAVLITFILSPLIGLGMALVKNKRVNLLMSIGSIVLYSFPVYLIIPLLIEKVALPLNLPFHSGFDLDAMKNFFFPLKVLILPYVALVYASIALYARLNRTLFLNLFNKPYIQVARSKGLSRFRILFIHVLRESIMIWIPLFLGSIGNFFGGLILVETLFEIRGFGFLFYQSILQQDYPVLLFSSLIISFLSMIGHLLADLFIIKFDPRFSHNEQITPFTSV